VPTSSGRKKEQPTGYHHGDLRQALIDAALRILAKKGSAQLNLRQLARQTGVSHAAPYRHFQDKNALLAAVAEEGFRKMTAKMRALAGTEANPVLRLQRHGMGYVQFATENPAHYRVMFGSELQQKHADESLAAASAEAFSVLLDAVVACQLAGLARPGDPMNSALFCWSGVHGLSLLLIDGKLGPCGIGKTNTHPLVEEITGLIVDSLQHSRR
jgi:AcrR family transcriptional regulator